MGRLRAFTSWITTATVTLALAASIVVVDRVVAPPSHVSAGPTVTATTVITHLATGRVRTTAVHTTSPLAVSSPPTHVVALSDDPVTTVEVTTTTVPATTTTSTTTTTTSTTTTTTPGVVVTTTTRPHYGDDGGGGGSDDG
ncbi:MAG TPA: hypothetical protein VIJ99_01140 [Acidimicrobiales bacterium]